MWIDIYSLQKMTYAIYCAKLKMDDNFVHKFYAVDFVPVRLPEA